MSEEPLDEITEAALVIAALTPLTAATAKKFLEELLEVGFELNEATLICRRGGMHVGRSVAAMRAMKDALDSEEGFC